MSPETLVQLSNRTHEFSYFFIEPDFGEIEINPRLCCCTILLLLPYEKSTSLFSPYNKVFCLFDFYNFSFGDILELLSGCMTT